MYFIKSRTKVFKQVDADIWFYCALRPLKYNNFLLRRYNIKYQARAKDKTDYQNLLVKAENRLRRIFLKKKSYFGKVLVLRRKLKLFFNFFSWNKIEKWFLSLYFKKKNDDFLSFESSLLQGIECLLFFFVFRLNYVLSFKEYAFFLQNGVFSVDGLVVRDVFFLLKVGGLLSINFNYHKSLFFRRVYVKFFGEYVRLGRFFLRGLVPYFYIFYYYKMLRSFRRERLNDLRIRSMRYFGRFKSLHIKNVVFPFEQILKINFNPSVQVFSKFSRFIKKWSIFYLYLFAYYFVFFYFYFFFFLLLNSFVLLFGNNTSFISVFFNRNFLLESKYNLNPFYHINTNPFFFFTKKGSLKVYSSIAKRIKRYSSVYRYSMYFFLHYLRKSKRRHKRFLKKIKKTIRSRRRVSLQKRKRIFKKYTKFCLYYFYNKSYMSKSVALWSKFMYGKVSALLDFFYKEAKKGKNVRFLRNKQFRLFLWDERKDKYKYRRRFFKRVFKRRRVRQYKRRKMFNDKMKRIRRSHYAQPEILSLEEQRRRMLPYQIILDVLPKVGSRKFSTFFSYKGRKSAPLRHDKPWVRKDNIDNINKPWETRLKKKKPFDNKYVSLRKPSTFYIKKDKKNSGKVNKGVVDNDALLTPIRHKFFKNKNFRDRKKFDFIRDKKYGKYLSKSNNVKSKKEIKKGFEKKYRAKHDKWKQQRKEYSPNFKRLKFKRGFYRKLMAKRFKMHKKQRFFIRKRSKHQKASRFYLSFALMRMRNVILNKWKKKKKQGVLYKSVFFSNTFFNMQFYRFIILKCFLYKVCFKRKQRRYLKVQEKGRIYNKFFPIYRYYRIS